MVLCIDADGACSRCHPTFGFSPVAPSNSADRASLTSFACAAPCRKLLAKVCLVREEIQNLARERAAARGGTADLPADSLRQGVPRRAVAFLKARVALSRAAAPRCSANRWEHIRWRRPVLSFILTS